MVVGKFTKAKEGAILGGDFTNAVFGTVATSFNDYICAVDIGSEILILDNGDVEYYAVISKKGMSRKTSNLINATTHAVISTLIPGASLAGAIAGHTAAAAAGVATGSAAAHAAGGIRDYRDVIVVFRDQKKCIIRCSDLYFKKIKKYCEERKLSEYEIDELLNSKSKHLDTKASPSEHAKKTNDPKHKYANDSVSSSRGDHSSEKQNYLDETHDRMLMDKKKHRDITPGTIIGILLIIGFIVWFFFLTPKSPSNSDSARELRNNAGKHYTEMEFSTLGACDGLISGTVSEYGDDRGYYCYKTTNADGDIVWRVGNAYD